MNTATIHIRTDKQLKKKTDTIFKDLGLNTSTAVNIFLRAVANNNGIPFELKTKVPNQETVKAMKDLKTRVDCKSYDSVDEFMTSLSKE